MSICLNMIIKDEAENLPGCLLSVIPLIDHWVIVDTGSTDNSCEIILNTLTNIPGELYKRPWINFGHNRTEALKLASSKCDYIITIDADFLCFINKKIELIDDAYEIVIINENKSKFNQLRIFKSSLNWKYVGVLHEYPVCDNYHNIKKSVLSEDILHYYNRHTGIRTKNPRKYLDDADLLEKDDHSNPRTIYYLAQSYRDGGELEKALINYKKRIEMGGWIEEVWSAYYNSSLLHIQLKHSEEIIVNSLLNTYNYWPRRAESLYQLAFYYRSIKKYQLGFLFAEKGLNIPFPKNEKLIVDKSIYDWRLLDEYATNAANALKYNESLVAYKKLILLVPEEHQVRILNNIHFIEKQI